MMGHWHFAIQLELSRMASCLLRFGSAKAKGHHS